MLQKLGGEFYVKVTYNKGFAKGTEYKIGINVGLSGYRTFATLLDTPNAYNQPLVTIRKEAVNTSTKTDITVEEKLNGNYGLEIEKVHLNDINEKISGVTFKVKDGNGEAKAYGPTGSDGIVKIFQAKSISQEGIDEYTITEVDLGKNEYIKIKDEIKVYVTKSKTSDKFVASKVSFEKDKTVINKQVKLEDGTDVDVTATISDNIVKITIPNKPREFDMALRKNISQVKRDGREVDIGVDRTPSINLQSAIEYSKNKTAAYYHTKNPITVKTGDTILYTIRVYNEGYINGYAKQITDYLPAGLEYIEDSEINKNNGWTITKNEDGTTTVKTDKLKDELILAADGSKGFAEHQLEQSKSEQKLEPSFSKAVQIECKVKEDVQDGKLLVNVAEITNYGYNDEQGNYIEANKDGVDIDSEEDNVFKNKDNIKNIDEYYENNIKPQYKEDNNFYKGVQDDDDFENIIVQPDEKEVVSGKYNIQIKKVDANDPSKTLQNAVFTVLDRNEIATDITTGSNGIATVASNVEIIKTEEGKTAIDNYVITEKSVPEGYVLIKDHQIIVRVTTGLTSDKKNYELKDVEVSISQKDGSQETAEEKEMLEKGLSKTISGNTITITIPNKPEEKDFDLALRKFITGVNDKEVTSRIPVFKIDENGDYVYNHDKEPVLVANSNIVTYTLRVYNEGEVVGYANEIKDDIPEGLEFLPDNDLNKEYRWIMLDKYGKETDDVDNAKYITTDYLSKKQEKTEGSNLLKPFDVESYEAGAINQPDYKEVKVAFKVNMPDKSEEIIINQAQISDDSDEDGNEVTDIDSTPNEWIDGEDDQDIEKIKIQYFDLALRKWVTKALVTESGVETVYETGHKAEDDPEEVVKVDLKKSDINNVTVKFEYKIRIENQGKIAGYAKEISDYIPEGLKFVKEDNPLWKEVDGKVVTDQLKDTLLQPGETAEVTILLTWINSEDNMGLKVNTAEISKDYNEYGTPDIDSTPNNQVPGEDDIDDAPVMLTVTTGEEPVYVFLTISILGILAVGLVTIKKFVL